MTSRYVAPDDAYSGANTKVDDRDSLQDRLDAEDHADRHAGAPLHDAEVDREHERLAREYERLAREYERLARELERLAGA